MALNFDNEIPEWKNEGIEPTTELKEKGFTGGYKPPATVFNWFWSKVQKCIMELQKKLSNLDDEAKDPCRKGIKKIYGQPKAECIYPTGGMIDFHNESGAVSIFGANGDEVSVGGEGINVISESEIILKTPFGYIHLTESGTLHLVPDGKVIIKDKVTITDNEFNVKDINFRPDEIVGQKSANNEKLSVLRNFLKVNADYINAGNELTEGGVSLKNKYAAKHHNHKESVYFAVCNTPGNEEIKRINIDGYTFDDMKDGDALFLVTFTNNDTCSTHPTLNINNSGGGGFDMRFQDFNILGGQLKAGVIYPMMYDGSSFQLIQNWDGFIGTK